MLSFKKSLLIATIMAVQLIVGLIGDALSPIQIDPKWGWGIFIILNGFLIILAILQEKFSTDNTSSPQLITQSIPDKDALLKNYLEKLTNEVRWVNLGGVDPKLAADAGRTDLPLSAIYIELETLEANSRRVLVVEVMKRENRLVLLGDPGSGKSTFIDFLTLCFTGEKLGLDANLNRLGTIWQRHWLLPVRVILRNFVARGLPPEDKKANSNHLWNFLKSEVGADFAPILHEYLQGQHPQQAFILLDGFDEVPEAEKRQEQMKDVIEDFIKEYPNCHFLMTSRTYAWERQGWQLPGFAEARLAPFSPQQIETFIDRWYTQTYQLRRGQMSIQRANKRAEELKFAISQKPKLAELASRPLLLTLMASLHAWLGTDLPEKREKLYDKTIDLLLDNWEGPKRIVDAQGKEILHPSVREWLKIDRDKLLEILEQISYNVHAGQVTTTSQGKPETADIPGSLLRQELSNISRDPNLRPGQISEFLENRAGLLIPVGNDVYRFPHRSFQEYLAARYIAKEKSDEYIANLILTEPERWQEVVLLAMARTSESRRFAVWNIIDKLIPALPSNNPTSSAGWAAYIAAASLIENKLYENFPIEHQSKINILKSWLIAIFEKSLLPPIEQATAGKALALLGDERPGVATLPPLLTQSIQRNNVDFFQAGVYLVTNAQFKQFMEENCYNTMRWWSEAGRLWLPNLLNERGQNEPAFWQKPHLNLPNQPVVGISYYEAEAFCNWLTEKFQHQYRLPTEDEWLVLAHGNTSNEYPWGNQWQENQANSYESGIGQPSAVGIFPISSMGVYDCTGNVWEWCDSWYNPNQSERVLRGGGWDSNKEQLRCTYRHWSNPQVCNHVTGFRVVSSL